MSRKNRATSRLNLLLGLLMLSSFPAFAQTYKCGAQAAAGVTYKLEMDIMVTDSAVVFISKGMESSFKRVPSNNSTIYFSDGQVTSSLLDFPHDGTVKGFVYNHMLTQETKGQKVVSYCWLKKD